MDNETLAVMRNNVALARRQNAIGVQRTIWTQFYADDVSLLLREVKRLQEAIDGRAEPRTDGNAAGTEPVA